MSQQVSLKSWELCVSSVMLKKSSGQHEMDKRVYDGAVPWRGWSLSSKSWLAVKNIIDIGNVAWSILMKPLLKFRTECMVCESWPSQWYAFATFTSSFCSAFQALSLGFNIFGELLRMWRFLNLTVEVVTFSLRKWCILCVFLLHAFTCLGHECQDLLNMCDGMHVCTD